MTDGGKWYMISPTRAANRARFQFVMYLLKLSKHLLSVLRTMIADARQDVARRVNSALVLLYWKVGQRIRQDILKEYTPAPFMLSQRKGNKRI